MQETFLRARKGIDTLVDDKAAKAWLITILRRENARRFERKQFDLVDLDEHPRAIRRRCTASRRWRTSGSDATSPACR